MGPRAPHNPTMAAKLGSDEPLELATALELSKIMHARPVSKHKPFPPPFAPQSRTATLLAWGVYRYLMDGCEGEYSESEQDAMLDGFGQRRSGNGRGKARRHQMDTLDEIGDLCDVDMGPEWTVELICTLVALHQLAGEGVQIALPGADEDGDSDEERDNAEALAVSFCDRVCTLLHA
jgi:hypothetical protein